MSRFFSYYPKTVYNLGDTESLDSITNLTTNFSFIGDLIDNTAAYYEYTIGEGETPEIIAHKVYGDAEFHWLLLKINNIIDYKTDWALDYKSLTESIDETYSASQYADTANTSVTGLQWAKSNIKTYYKIETRTIVGSNIIEKDEIVVDQNTYSNVVVSVTPSLYPLDSGDVLSVSINKTTETYYDYEIAQNEEKREIKILKSEFVSPLFEEFKNVMRDEQ